MRTTLLLLFAATSFAASVKAVKVSGTMEVSIEGKSVTALHYGEKWDKPFVYPLQTPSGIIVSRGWPVALRTGDSQDHIWHRGILFGHGDVNGVDFWRELGREKTGRFVPRSAPKWRRGTLTIEADMVPPKGKRLGSVREEFRFNRVGPAYIIDTRVSISADAGVDLTLGDTEEAAFAVRLSEEFRQDRGAALINSEGLKDTGNIWGRRARWVDYSTTKDGRKVGVAIFDHPANPKHPTYWHARGYSLNSANIFGVRSFTKDKTQDGAVVVKKGDSLTFRTGLSYTTVMPARRALKPCTPALLITKASNVASRPAWNNSR